MVNEAAARVLSDFTTDLEQIGCYRSQGQGCRNGLIWICDSADLDFRFWMCLLWLGLGLGYLV